MRLQPAVVGHPAAAHVDIYFVDYAVRLEAPTFDPETSRPAPLLARLAAAPARPLSRRSRPATRRRLKPWPSSSSGSMTSSASGWRCGRRNDRRSDVQAFLLRALARLAQDEEPGLLSGDAGGGRGLGAIMMVNPWRRELFWICLLAAFAGVLAWVLDDGFFVAVFAAAALVAGSQAYQQWPR
jgi:hypothetical protein